VVAGLAVAGVALSGRAALAEPRNGVIGEESRQPLRRFAPEGVEDRAAMRRALRATQRMVCGDQAATANLVADDRTVITVAHLLVRPDGTRRDIRTCRFIVDRDGRSTSYRVLAETLRIGPFRGQDNRIFGVLEIVNDWMVVRLARPVRGIAPYALGGEDDLPRLPMAPLVTLSALSDNWPVQDEALRLAEACRLRRFLGAADGRHAVLMMDCDVGFGSSGGAIVAGLDGGTPRIVGLLTDFKEEGACAAFDAERCFSAGVALRAHVLEAIAQARAPIRAASRRRQGSAP
jgi:hypothetical protein